MTSEESPHGQPNDEFPVAEIRPAATWSTGKTMHSKLWWVTLCCLGVAIYLSWHSHRPSGIEITIDFPDGHGLKAGDALRHRGIDIGIVTQIELQPDLHGVRATVELDKTAAGVANDGSQFWIVRPQLSLTNISGLETAVGSKYIAVDPGPAGRPRAEEFSGLKDPPAIGIDHDGTEILLRGRESFGINPRSPVTYRGIQVGQVLSVELGRDAMSVVVKARIDKHYAILLRRGSKFWKTSGVDVDFGIKGIHLSTESLTTMAKGGVSFATPKTRDDSDLEPIQAGHEFELHEEMDKDWLEDAAPIQILP